MDNMSESEFAQSIVERIIAGDAKAEKEMVKRYQRGLMFMLRKRSGDEHLAADVSQDTWRLVIEKVRQGQLKDPKKLSAFIVQIGKNQLIMHYRRPEAKKTDSLDETQTRAMEATEQPEKVLENHNLALMVRSVIGELNTPRDRELIFRFFIDEQEKHVICHELDLDKVHFDRVLYRAKQRFKQLWDSQFN
ncbi:RNA polymerase sigma factor [Agaribacter flavus]|uniref:RNA polymerase sigma factor n=1 Tax=Agaribacter flavus TaxID=1902781 RepID=A0ABV7FMR3_9ALTE